MSEDTGGVYVAFGASAKTSTRRTTTKFNPVERCWGTSEKHWNGTILVGAPTMLECAKRITWTGLYPVVDQSRRSVGKPSPRRRLPRGQ